MKFSAAAVLAVAAGVSAFENVTYTTEVVTAVTTFCPAATMLTHAGSTYTISEATTLTITDCPCTITRPVTTVASVACTTCPVASAAASSAPVYTNGTGAHPTSVSPNLPAGTGSSGSGSGSGAGVGGGVGGSSPSSSSTTSPSPIATAGAGKAAALSGAGLAGVLGLAAFFL